MKEHLQLKSHEKLSADWKKDILVPIKDIYQEDNPEIQVGFFFDPAKYIPQYLKRFLMRQEKEGKPLPPGHYNIVLKVIILQIHVE